MRTCKLGFLPPTNQGFLTVFINQATMNMVNLAVVLLVKDYRVLVF